MAQELQAILPNRQHHRRTSEVYSRFAGRVRGLNDLRDAGSDLCRSEIAVEEV